MAKKHTNKILVIGWDAADWDVIEPLIQQGKMPALQRLMSDGVYGRLKTMDPPLSPMLWTSIATGMRADKHGICGFVEPGPDGETLKPVSSKSRKVKAFWNIYTQLNKKCNVVAWWPSNPVEKINGVMVSNLYQVSNKDMSTEWEMAEGTVHPSSFEEKLKSYRVHPAEISPFMVHPFIPNIKDNTELRKDKRVSSVAKVIANASSVHAATTYLMTNTEWDLMAVYHDAIDHFSHVAMKYHPPRRSFVPEADYENFKGVVEAGYMFHDMMLERTLDLIDKNTTVILVSDHGFYPDHRRPVVIPKEPSGPAAEHSPYGIVVMSGPGIRKGGQTITGASVIDVTPTILALSGIAVGRDMEGKVLFQAFEHPVEPDYVDSWDDVEGDSGMHDPNLTEDPWAAQEALQQLVELGYIEELDDNKLQMVERSKTENEYYKARNMIDGGRVKEAIPILDRIFRESGIIRYGQRLAFAYLQTRNFEKLKLTIKALRDQEKLDLEAAKAKKRQEKEDDPFLNTEFEEPKYLDYIEGLMLLALNRPLKALKLLEGVMKKNPNSAEVSLNIARIYLLRKDYIKAQKMFISSLAVDPTNPQALHGLGLAFLRQGRIEESIEEFLSAVEYNFYLPNVHYHLGEAFSKIGDYANAAQAFEVAVKLAPGMTKAHKWLVEIYSTYVKDATKEEVHREFLDKNIRGELLVVTGLPRSGMSAVLQMLEKGGFPVYQEIAEESADRKGKLNHEFSKISKLKTEASFRTQVEGRAVVVLPNLLTQLPNDINYKVIRLKRDLSDVLVSQQKVLGRKLSADTIPIKMLNTQQKQSRLIDTWIDTQPNIAVLNIEFEDLINSPKEIAMCLVDFLGKDLNYKTMSKIIKKSI
jgi:predicted AlkP superfamily phosphohydrolase/phosphomutase/tetratricopeptide (TPR) repeat protein